MIDTCVLEEVFDHADERTADHFLVEFLAHLAFYSAGGGLAEFDPSTGQGPEAVAFQAMQQHRVVPNEERGGPELEAMNARAEADHAHFVEQRHSLDRSGVR